MKLSIVIGLFLSFFVSSLQAASDTASSAQVKNICEQIGKKLSSVSTKECLTIGFAPPRFFSVSGAPLLEKRFHSHHANATRILFIGGIHGDEYSSVSVTFKWLKHMQQKSARAYDWLFMPLTNPDGLLQAKSTRVNGRQVDLNRNFIPAEHALDPVLHWKEKAYSRARYYPGEHPLSEPEAKAIHTLIDEYQPHIIVSVHAPHGILDFDGSSLNKPTKLGPLRLKQLGTYPGSLGNYAWFVKGIPVMTIELTHAGIMPTDKDIGSMWGDLLTWVEKKSTEINPVIYAEQKK